MGMIESVAEKGYAQTSVADVLYYYLVMTPAERATSRAAPALAPAYVAAVADPATPADSQTS